eukprot:4004864-Pyramimonas_sp.AAC.1
MLRFATGVEGASVLRLCHTDVTTMSRRRYDSQQASKERVCYDCVTLMLRRRHNNVTTHRRRRSS